MVLKKEFSVLFVCTGNICRSPVAEFYLRSKTSPESITVHSAGIAAHSSQPMDRRSRKFLANLDDVDDGSAFLSQPVTNLKLGEFNLILGMEQLHVNHLLSQSPELLRRCFTLKQLAKWVDSGAVKQIDDIKRYQRLLPQVNDRNISDPVGSEDSVYEETMEEIISNIEFVLPLFTSSNTI